jgi:hypothetical protein
MPAWTNDPTFNIKSLLPGVPRYSAGSKLYGPTVRFAITASAVATNVVTLTGAIIEGNIPSVGDVIYVKGTSRNSGQLNQGVGELITGVSINAATGVGTISYSQSTANLAPGADSGAASITISDVAETLIPSTAYEAFAIPRLTGQLGANPSITIWVTFPSAPDSIKWSLQVAERNIDAEYVDLLKDETAGGTFSDSALPAASTNAGEFWPGAFNFVRFADTGSSGGTLPTVIARISI